MSTAEAKQRKRDLENARREKCGRRDGEDMSVMTLIAFPEPEKYIQMIIGITERSHEDHRTIEHRSGKSVAGPLGRAQLAGE